MQKNIRDLTGQKFGELTVLEATPERRCRSVVWLCRCSCGRLVKAAGNNLVSGGTTSCGHVKAMDLTGQQFGELTALERTGERRGTSVVWLCQCSCGRRIKVASSSLVSGKTKSCGHTRATDLTGQRFGRLVALKPMRMELEPGQQGVPWLCRCDCGCVAVGLSISLTCGRKLSCGCINRRRGRGWAICPGCGESFGIALDGQPTPQFCPDCAPKYAGRSWRVCPICRKLFPAPPSSNAVTCSKECSAAWKSKTHKGITNLWTEESRARKRAEGLTENLKMGTPAAMASPIAGRFETNQEAKVWHLVDPTGNEVVVRNLLLWARDNAERFGKPEGDRSASQIAGGFRQIAQTLRGKRKTPAMTYFGWTLKGLPEDPQD